MRIEFVEADTERVIFRTNTRSVRFGNDPLEWSPFRFGFETASFLQLDFIGRNSGTMKTA
jgi:hypothetical protein